MIMKLGLATTAAAVALGLGLGGCAASDGAPPATTGAIAPAPTPAPTPTPTAAREDFQSWLAGVRREASDAGLSAATLDAALGALQPVPRVLELDRKQPESTQSFQHYITSVVSADRVALCRKKYAENKALLDQVSRRFHVPARYVVALWSVESGFGAAQGGFEVIPSLATLAYESERKPLFRAELLAALKILDETGMPPAKLKGSWAGAMGQSQFMPSTYLRYAVSFDGAGRPDIWANRADALASIANYLSSLDWREAEGWGGAVRAPEALKGLVGYAASKPVDAWIALGVTDASGRPLPSSDLEAWLIEPDGPSGPAYLVHPNFRALMKWNRSTWFAASVGILADRIGNG